MMIIIMMVIKRKKNLLQMLHFYHARWHSLIVAPRALDGGGWHLPRILVQVSGLNGVWGQTPLLQQEADAPSVSLCTFSPQ